MGRNLTVLEKSSFGALPSNLGHKGAEFRSSRNRGAKTLPTCFNAHALVQTLPGFSIDTLRKLFLDTRFVDGTKSALLFL